MRNFLILTFAGALVLNAQQFEVASIKPSGTKSVRDFEGGPGSKDPGLYHAHVASLLDLIAHAWKVDYFQVISTTSVDRLNFDLDAKIPPGATKEEFRVMLQNLLAERFALKTHMETREFPAYELIEAKTGAKLKESDPAVDAALPKDGWPSMPPGRPNMASANTMVGGYWLVKIKAQMQPLSRLADLLGATTDGMPVVDKTGLNGKYTFTLEYMKDMPGRTTDGPSSAPDLSTALKQQLGLQIVSKKLPFEVVVVDSFSKTPIEN